MEGFSVLMSVYKNDTPRVFLASLDSITKYQSLLPSQIIIVKDGPVSDGIDEVITSHIDSFKDINFTVIAKPPK